MIPFVVGSLTGNRINITADDLAKRVHPDEVARRRDKKG